MKSRVTGMYQFITNVYMSPGKRWVWLLVTIVFMSACNINGLIDSTDLPSHIKDPSVIKTKDGALGLYHRAVSSMASAMSDGADSLRSNISDVPGNFVAISGVLTDELKVDENVSLRQLFFIDLRDNLEDKMGLRDEGNGQPYRSLQRVRGRTREAWGALRKYYPDAPNALQGHLLAIEALSELYLAEIYCSGIPLSTIDFESNFTLTRGFTTEEVYRNVLSLLDSAEVYAVDSVRFINLINVGRARAHLAMGNFNEASKFASLVPDDFKYQFAYGPTRPKFVPRLGILISDREGINGLPFVSNKDPRTQLPSITNPNSPFVLASGIEARLIEAEADLIADRPTWLDRLNELRTSCAEGASCPNPAPPGVGGVVGLPPLEDPAVRIIPDGKDNLAVRVDLLFEERAYWLFLTGRRQADLRRLVRYYGRDQSTVYPIGVWGIAQMALYGNDVTLPLPTDEFRKNPLYEGCYHRDA